MLLLQLDSDKSFLYAPWCVMSHSSEVISYNEMSNLGKLQN